MLDKLKGVIKSSTIWFNTVGITILSAAMIDPMVTTYLTANGLSLVLVIGNIILRFKTTKSLADK